MIAIVDYGVGNLRSVYKSFETVAGPLGIQVDIVDHPVDFTRWRALVLPGQGAFGDSINNLRRQGFEAPLLDSVAASLPLLGICVGMQMLFDESEEMGVHEGLHLIPGRVRRFPAEMPDPNRSGRSLRIPQIGWNQLHQQRPDPLLAGVPDGAYGYFAHSYFCDATRGGRRTHAYRLWHRLSVDCPPQQCLGHSVPSREEPYRWPAYPAQFHPDCGESASNQ